jgi:uncharacterized protein (TIGR02246 family)
MKKFFLFSIFLLLLQMTSFAQDKVSKNEKEVRAALDNWAAAIVSRDASALESVYADDLIVTDYNGGTRGKKEELQVLVPVPGMKTVSVKNEDVRIRDHGKAIVVTAITKMHFVINEKDVNTNLRYTAVFVKTGGRWQITALQIARIAPPKPN